jgi:hypothetical protein
MTNRVRVLVATVVVSSIAAVALAGTSYKFTCNNEKCGFKGSVDFGGGFKFEQITGYCTQCQKFVYLRWPREAKSVEGMKSKPKSVGLVWDAATGQNKELYACPDCKSGFLPIASENELRFCPKCGQESLKLKRALLYD